MITSFFENITPLQLCILLAFAFASRFIYWRLLESSLYAPWMIVLACIIICAGAIAMVISAYVIIMVI